MDKFSRYVYSQAGKPATNLNLSFLTDSRDVPLNHQNENIGKLSPSKIFVESKI